MSEWTPKVGDRVMFQGEQMKVVAASWHKGAAVGLHDTTGSFWWARKEWLTPAPDPVPDEPTAPGALVRDGRGRLWALDYAKDWVLTADADLCFHVGDCDCLLPGAEQDWIALPRPITVVLADPAEVETLRAERDELQRRIDAVLAKEDSWGGILYHAITQILRGEQ